MLAYQFFQEQVLVAARRPLTASPARLILVHPATLDAVLWGEEEVSSDGTIFLLADSVYTPVLHRGAWHLGRFDGQLKLAARSEAPVRPESSIAAFGADVYVTDPEDRVLVLDRASLVQRAVIPKP